MTGWVDSIEKKRARNWEVAKQAGLWGTRSPSGRDAAEGDELFLWASTRGWLARCRVTSKAREPRVAADKPWKDTDYRWVMGIELINELDEPAWMPGDDLKRLFERDSTAPVGQFYALPGRAVDELRALLPERSRFEVALAELVEVTGTEVPPDGDRRDYAQRLIAIRRGQTPFRQGLLQAFDHTCCISGSRVEATLEAAHIRPFRETGSHAPGNGLLLRADLHTLFDLRLVTVLPYGTVRIAPELHGSEYEEFDERQIRRPVDAGHVPLREALAEHNALCGWLA